MKVAIASALAVLVVMNAPALAERSRLFVDEDGTGTGVYDCTIVDAHGIDEQGALSRNDLLAQDFAETYRVFSFNADDGTFVAPHQTTHWEILRYGNSQWDLIAHLPGHDPWFNMVRIEVWNTPVKFSLTDGNNFFSGLCSKAR